MASGYWSSKQSQIWSVLFYLGTTSLLVQSCRLPFDTHQQQTVHPLPPGDYQPVSNNIIDNSTRIVGGTWVKRGDHPYQAAIFLRGKFTCGGTLITRQHVLIAAHCLDIPGIKPSDFKIYLLTTVLDPLDAGYIERSISKFIFHEDYNATKLENDIGLLKLSEPVYSVRLARLESAESTETYAGEQGTIIGWGRTRQIIYPNVSSGDPSNNLRQVNVTIIGAEDCKAMYYGEYDIVDNGSKFCASTLHGKGMCQGDSGGPILVRGIQIGINSAAAGCADPRFPAIFTRVARYRDWIVKTIISF